MCNPEDQSPVTDGEPSQDAARRDHRSTAQRSLMPLSSCDGGGVVSLAGAKHRVEHVDTSAGKGEHCFAVTLAFAAFALVVGLAGRIAADRAECRVEIGR